MFDAREHLEKRADLRAGHITAAVYNSIPRKDKRVFTPVDFFPSLDTKRQADTTKGDGTSSTMADLAAIQMWAATTGIPLRKADDEDAA